MTRPAPVPSQTLDPDKIVETVDRLSRRIDERFPGAGLHQVCCQLCGIASQAKQRSAAIGRPFWLLRIGTVLVVLAIIGGTTLTLLSLNLGGDQFDELAELVQVMEAAINDLVLIGAAVFFLATLEIRIKRRRALSAIHELRALAHIVDMHQLTKDPERLRADAKTTKTSPTSNLTRYELGRYLDYCSEMLSLIGKVAALYIQNFDDAVAVAAANDVEQLCTGLSRKIWQKIMILQTLTQ